MRTDPIDDAAVLKAARRVWTDGTYPTGIAVTRELDYRWAVSTVSAALSRLRASGRLAPPQGKPASESDGTRLTPDEIDRRAREVREVRYEGARKPAEPTIPIPSRGDLDVYVKAMRNVFGRDWLRLYRRVV